MTLSVQPIVRHVVQYLQADEEAKVVEARIQIEDRPVEDLYFPCVKELPMVLSHSLFALRSQMGRYLDENVFAVPVHVQIIVLVKVEHRVRERARAWPYLDDSQLPLLPTLQKVEHVVGYGVAVEGFE